MKLYQIIGSAVTIAALGVIMSSTVYLIVLVYKP